MTAVLLCLRANLRARGRSWLVLALIIGLGGGLIIATAAGARRTESALSRHVSTFRVADAAVVRGFWVDGRETLDFDRVERLPQVVAASRWAQLAAILRTRSGKPVLPDGDTGVAVGILLDERAGDVVDRAKLLYGRMPDPGRADEALVDSTAFKRLGYSVGDTVQLRLVSHDALWGRPSAADRLTADPTTTAVGPLTRVRIVGVVATLAGTPGMLTLPVAFARAHPGGQLGPFLEGVSLRLERGAEDLPAFERAFRQVAGPDYPGLATPEGQHALIQDPIRLQANVLKLLAGFGAVVLLLFVAHAFAREELLRSAHRVTLRALGMPRRQLVALAACGGALVGAVASGVAVLLAILLSPLAPIGRARELEPAPGLDVDFGVLAVGAAALLLATIAAATLVAVRSTRAGAYVPARTGNRRTPAEAAARLGLPPTAVSGVRLALSRGRGVNAVPVRTTLAAVSLAVAVVAAAATFSASLSHLLSTPRLYGVNFDYLFWSEGPPGGRVPDRRLVGDPDIAAFASGTVADVTVDGAPMVAVAHEDVKGAVSSATVVEGREPARPGEILLGSRTLAALHLRVGDIVTVRSARGANMRVVGSGFVARPLFGAHPFDTGAVLTFSGLRRIEPDAAYTDYRLRISPSADREAVLDRLERNIGLGRLAPPTQIARFGGLAAFPLAFAILFGVLGATMLAHALLVSIRRRRSELALLKTLGFDGRQVVATVAWQATTIAVVGLAVGLPLGAALGRFGWNVFADRLGILPAPVIPLYLVLAIPGTILLANAVAALPARIAARTRPAVALRAE